MRRRKSHDFCRCHPDGESFCGEGNKAGDSGTCVHVSWFRIAQLTPDLLSERVCPGVPIDQKPNPLTHVRSSVGARPSSAAPVHQNQLHYVDIRISFSSVDELRITWVVLLDGGGRGRTRSD